MDIAKPKLRPKSPNPKRIAVVVVVLLSLAVAAYLKNSFNQVSLVRKDILIAQVQFGDVDLVVEGYGTLKSQRQQILTTLTTATVQEIVLKPGAIVAEGSVITVLSNPEVNQEAENAGQELALSKANLRQLVVNQHREVLDEEAKLAELTSQYESAKLRRVAEEKLVKSGIVSELAFKESQLNEKQLQQRVGILSERAEQLFVVHKEAINIQNERIKQQQGKFSSAQNRVDKLVVRASFDGVLQRLSIELGQSLTAGQEVALIGSATQLIALIQVPQSKAQQIVRGQKVIVDTRLDKIIGSVTRIDPIVENNTVQIEIALPNDLPKSARVQQSVDATIVTEKLVQVYYIKRPANVRAHSEVSLYKLNPATTRADRTAVTLGGESTLFMEIKEGVSEGERFVISDLSNYETKQIVIR